MKLIPTARLAEAAARRGRTYWLLAQCFGAAPQPAALQEWAAALGPAQSDDELAGATEALRGAVGQALTGDQAVESLAIDYTRLFGGVSASYGAPPPFESVARTGSWGGDAVHAVIAAYRSAEIAPPLPEASPPDHLAAELRFMAIACHRESEAWLGGETEEAMGWISHERDFLDRHLLEWMPAYCQQCEEMARTPFYRALTALAPQACQLDRDDIEAIIETVHSETSV